jgi:alginate O-acetyltransferase complex protein AlgI
MLFNSWEFLILCLVTLVLYYVPPLTGNKVWQVTVLLVASALFYAWEEPRLLILLSASCLLNAVAVERILFWKNQIKVVEELSACKGLHTIQGSGPERIESPSRAWLIWTVALNLGFLAFFKYAGFLTELLPESTISNSLTNWFKTIPLPVGISFYTFQGISLVVDVWRNDISTQTRHSLSGRGINRVRSIRDTSFYVAFFPQLVAGPIVKAHEFVDQIGSKKFSDIDWTTVRRGLIVGYFLKIFVADNLAEQTGVLALGAEQLATTGPINLMSLLYGYSLQIFADFAGYSLIAIGLGALFGYTLPQNFKFPYLSSSITEFWRRWHLSLSSWLRDYLYIPLGGNRKGSGRTYFNLFLVMFLGGLWHGAAWKFALWGSLHGIFLALERLTAIDRKKVCSQSPLLSMASALALFRWICTFHLITALWLTFMMPDLDSIAAFFQGMLSGNTGFSGPPIFSLLFYGSAIVLYHGWGWLMEHKHSIAEKLSHSRLEPCLHGIMLFLILTNPGAPRGFIYFQF